MGKTGKTGQPAWAKRILKLLEQAKAKDPDFVRFGAYSHKYKLSPPVSEETIQNLRSRGNTAHMRRRSPLSPMKAPGR